MIELALFLSFASLLLFSAIMTIFADQVIESTLWLVLCFFSATGLWLLVEAEFLGLVLVLVYVGAVLTLFLFVIMTTSKEQKTTINQFSSLIYQSLSLLIVISWLTLISYVVYERFIVMQSQQIEKNISNTQALGNQLYTQYLYPFELIGILLLATIVSTMTVHHQSHQNKEKKKFMSQKEQIAVQSKERIRLVKGD